MAALCVLVVAAGVGVMALVLRSSTHVDEGAGVRTEAITARSQPTAARPSHRTARRAARAAGRVPATAAHGFFSPTSVWNAPVPAGAPVDPSSPALVRTLIDTVRRDEAAGRGPWIATTESSTPIYRVPADQPTVRVRLDTGPWANTMRQAFRAVPIPAGAQPAQGPDGHMAIWQPASDRFWELFHAHRQADGWHADFGGAIEHLSQSPGYYSKASWPGLSGSFWGAAASSLPVAAGVMRIDELRAGHITHALNMAIPVARARAYSWPAQRTDGGSTAPDAIPEGARFRLDPSLDLAALHLPRPTRLIAEAAQRYGILVTDQTGFAVGLFAEDPTPTGTDPYTGRGGLFGGLTPKQILERFPWQHLRLMRMQLHGT